MPHAHAGDNHEGDGLPGRWRPEGVPPFASRREGTRPGLGLIRSIRFIRYIRITLSVEASHARRTRRREEPSQQLLDSRFPIPDSRLPAPRRLHPIHPRVRDELAEMLVQVPTHHERGLQNRRVAAE